MKILIEKDIYSVPPELLYLKDKIPKDIDDAFDEGAIKALKEKGKAKLTELQTKGIIELLSIKEIIDVNQKLITSDYF